MPNPFTKCKSANRLVTALDAGLATIADGIQSFMPFRDVCILDEWETGLAQYLSSPTNRARDVAGARALIDARYRLPHIAGLWWQWCENILGSRSA